MLGDRWAGVASGGLKPSCMDDRCAGVGAIMGAAGHDAEQQIGFMDDRCAGVGAIEGAAGHDVEQQIGFMDRQVGGC